MAKLMSRYIKQFKIKHAEELQSKDGKTRLSLLAQFLRNIPEDRFCLVSWADAYFTEDVCGTTACACGWATTIFPNLGLDTGGDLILLDDNKDQAFDDEGYSIWGIEAAESFFDISNNVAVNFFIDSYYRSDACGPIDVANRIDYYLNTGEIL